MFCPECGAGTRSIRDLSGYWAEAWRCLAEPERAFIRILDTRNSYPRLELQPGVAAAIEQADDELLRVAFARLKRVDHRTISILFFEQTLLGCYDAGREYRVVYPDGSST
jgi:hypothetical protein